MSVSLREIFTPLVSYALLFARTAAHQQRPFAEVRGEMQRLLEAQRALVRRHDIPAPDYDTACFAVVAWIDELVLTSAHDTNPDLYNQWRRSPLQVERFQTANAGEEFFDRLEQLNPAQKEIREIYHLCLSLGFRGRYYDDTQEYKVAALRKELGARLPTSFLDLLEIDKQNQRVTPQPYAVPAPPPRRLPRSFSPLWALAALLALAAVLAWWLIPAAPRVNPEEIMAAVRKRVAPFACCDVDVLGYQDGVITMQGSVESEQQRQQIHQEAQMVDGVTGVRDTFRIIPRPFCEVVELLTPFQQQGNKAGVGLRGQPQNGCDTVYHNGSNLVIDVKAQQPLQYVYIDYFAADREYVAHVIPNPRQPDNYLQGATGVTAGAPGSEPRWAVQAPFGLELLTVITSKQQLFQRPHLAAEKAATYLAELRKVLPADPAAADIAATYCFITTQDGAAP